MDIKEKTEEVYIGYFSNTKYSIPDPNYKTSHVRAITNSKELTLMKKKHKPHIN